MIPKKGSFMGHFSHISSKEQFDAIERDLQILRGNPLCIFSIVIAKQLRMLVDFIRRGYKLKFIKLKNFNLNKLTIFVQVGEQRN